MDEGAINKSPRQGAREGEKEAEEEANDDVCSVSCQATRDSFMAQAARESIGVIKSFP